MPETLTIEPMKAGGKGRRFQVSLLSFITADRFWDGSARTAYRPIFLSYAETDQQVKAFTANLRTGRPATVRDRHGNEEAKQIEITRGSGMKWSAKRLPTGITIMTGYMPALCDLDPGLMPDRITFLFAPPAWWVEQQTSHPTIQALPEAIRIETVLGGYFCAFVDKRSPYPIVPDSLFHRRLYLACRKRWWFHEVSGGTYTPGPVWAYPESLPAGLASLGFVDAPHGEFQDLLKGETARYFQEESPAWLYAPEEEMALAADPSPDVEPEMPASESQEPEEIAALPAAQYIPAVPMHPAQLSLFDFA